MIHAENVMDMKKGNLTLTLKITLGFVHMQWQKRQIFHSECISLYASKKKSPTVYLKETMRLHHDQVDVKAILPYIVSFYDQWLDFCQVDPGSTPWLCLHILGNWSASFQLELGGYNK